MGYSVSSLSGVPLHGFEVPIQPEVPSIQVSTMQVPCGPFSIFDLEHHDLPEFRRAVYLAINEHSNWDTGISHPLSYQRLSDYLNVNDLTQVAHAVRDLIADGWLFIEGRCKLTGANIYKVVHHRCDPCDVPLDRDNRPQKCAVPRGAGSPSALLAAGKITWREWVYWIVRKVHSDWTDGISRLTIKAMSKLIRFSWQNLCDIPKRLEKLGLFKRISAKFRETVLQLFPGPYPKRRKRKPYKGKRPLPYLDGWYYSYNKRWRFHKDTLRLMMEDVDGSWRHASMSELLEINSKIYHDFRDWMDAATSHVMEAFRELRASFSSS